MEKLLQPEDTSSNILSTTTLDPSFSKNSCTGTRPVFREITNEEYSSCDIEEKVQGEIKDWSQSLELLPPLSHEKIHGYMVLGESFDNKERGAIKHKIAGYQLFKDGYVKKVRVKPNIKAEKLSFIVKSFVVASMRKDRYTVYVHLCQASGDILYAKCNCKAGASGCCKHVAALLYQLVEFKQLNLNIIPDDKTCTDKLQQWHVPGEGRNEAIKFSELKFEKANITKDLLSTRKRPIVCGKRDYCASPIFTHEPSQEKIKKLSDDLFALGQGVVFANLLESNNYVRSSFYETSITTYNNLEVDQIEIRQVVSGVVESLNGSLELNLLKSDDQDFVTRKLQMSHADVAQIESTTLQQSLSDTWYDERKKRLTSSNFGYVINRRKNIYPKSILQKCFPENLGKIKSTACEWGKNNESEVLLLYEKQFKVQVEKCGFFVNPKWPWLGASPDGIFKSGDSVKAIEVKCPYSKINMSILEACGDKKFFLQLDNGQPKLKKNHVHFFQCQGVLAITELQEIDFIVYTVKDMHIETISFDKALWESKMLPELTDFYFEFLKDKITI